MSAGLFARIWCSSGVIFGVSSVMGARYPVRTAGNREEWQSASSGTAFGVFFFFSSGIGCLGSIVLSIVLTLILMAIF